MAVNIDSSASAVTVGTRWRCNTARPVANTANREEAFTFLEPIAHWRRNHAVYCPPIFRLRHARREYPCPVAVVDTATGRLRQQLALDCDAPTVIDHIPAEEGPAKR